MTTVEQVIAWSAAEGIVVGATIERVIAFPADQSVLTRITLEQVVLGPTGEEVVARSSDQSVLALAADELIILRTTVEVVIARSAAEGVLARSPDQGVVTLAAVEFILLRATYKVVIAPETVDGIVITHPDNQILLWGALEQVPEMVTNNNIHLVVIEVAIPIKHPSVDHSLVARLERKGLFIRSELIERRVYQFRKLRFTFRKDEIKLARILVDDVDELEGRLDRVGIILNIGDDQFGSRGDTSAGVFIVVKNPPIGEASVKRNLQGSRVDRSADIRRDDLQIKGLEVLNFGIVEQDQRPAERRGRVRRNGDINLGRSIAVEGHIRAKRCWTVVVGRDQLHPDRDRLVDSVGEVRIEEQREVRRIALSRA